MDVFISEEYMVKRRMEKKLAARKVGGSNTFKSDNNGEQEQVTKKGHSSSPFVKILKSSHCYQFHSLGGFHELPLLEMLFLKNCMNLTNVRESILNCDELILIDLTYCKEFRKLIGTLTNLKKAYRNFNQYKGHGFT
ncbi:hypothetical protein CTI12_AA609120 [Artemisia annua]|uniref:Uncharacterized protein n=1 Tax=Artemisia annua TaxID=35608 RepID=A0A2U1KFD8_ARTAN|nr:hypothetical protein CTI12_AA609120 [Artemisia annua]